MQRFSASLFQIIVDQHFVCSAWPISAASLAATASASTGMTPIRPRTSPGVHQDHRPSVYDDPPPRAPDLGDFLASEPPAHSPAHLTNNLLRRLPRPHPVIDYEGPSSSELRPPTRGQRLKFRSSTATTSSRSSGADTEDMRLLLSNSFDASRLYVAIEQLHTEPVRVHSEKAPPTTLEPRLLELN